MRSIILATRNPGKLREIRRVLADLAVDVEDLGAHADLAEPPEHGESFADNARAKAMHYARATGKWCLADDSGLVVDALGGAPGVRSARYAAGDLPPDATREQIDAANNAKLLAELDGVPDGRRTARFVCHLALSDGRRILIETFDTVEGRIARRPRGENGFGYDPLFVADERGCTTAELSPEDKDLISHRGKAVRHFARLLRSFLSRRGEGG